MTNVPKVYMDDIEAIDDESPQSFEKLKGGVLSSDTEIRQRSFSKLSFFDYDEEIKSIFVQGLSDKDEFIRSDCVEHLADFDLFDNLAEITNLLNDPSYFVVYSSIISLADLESNKEKISNILINKLNDISLQSGIVLRIHYALYKLDSDYIIEHLLDCYSKSRDYRDRCAILSLLTDGCREEDLTNVKVKLKQIVNPTDFRSVLSEYDDFLESTK